MEIAVLKIMEATKFNDIDEEWFDIFQNNKRFFLIKKGNLIIFISKAVSTFFKTSTS